MVSSCLKHKFKKDTLFLALAMMDRVIVEGYDLNEGNYELTSACLVLLTTKYNEVYPVTIDQLNLLMADKYYLRDDYLEIEGDLLEVLQFQIPEETLYSRLANAMRTKQARNTVGELPSGHDSDKENYHNGQKTDRNVSYKGGSWKLS